jgi:hypothetical protein
LKGYVLVEGHGEVEAVGNLIHRVSHAAGLHAPWSQPIRWRNIHLRFGGTLSVIQSGSIDGSTS